MLSSINPSFLLFSFIEKKKHITHTHTHSLSKSLMVHTMDEIEDWEIIQASINQDFFSLDPPINHTSFGEEQLNTTNDNSPLLNHYREPEQLRNNCLVLPDGEHESTETEGDAVVSDQERNSVGKEAAGRKKPWPVVWWKSQLDNLFKYFGVVGISCKPAWCMSVVTAVISFVVLRKRVFGMKYNRKSVTTSRKVCASSVH